MKRLKQIISQIQSIDDNSSQVLTALLWQYICYAPKMPVRLQQQQLLDQSEIVTLKVNDEYFAKGELRFNTFRWGKGKHKVLITHGWGSKALDLTEIITALSLNNDFEIIAFDAPGNGSSEGDLSNLLLFIQSIKAIVAHYGKPEIAIGHSLGAMANVIAFKEMNIKVSVLISLAPLLRLKENFEASMNAIGISASAQTEFLNSFQKKFGMPVSDFVLTNWYDFDGQFNHWLAYDVNDHISPFSYLNIFLEANPGVDSRNYPDVGHDKIIKSPLVINDLIGAISATRSF